MRGVGWCNGERCSGLTAARVAHVVKLPQRHLCLARSFEGWYNVCWRVSCYFPGITLLVLTVLNLLIHHTGSSGAIPLGAFFSLVSLWFVVSIPLCYSGAPPPYLPA